MDHKAEVERFVSTDVAKARVDVHVRPDGRAFGGATAPEGLSALVDRPAGAVAAAAHRARGPCRCRGQRRLQPGAVRTQGRALRRYLFELYRIDPERVATIGKGERELLLPEQPTAAPNRRVRVINRG